MALAVDATVTKLWSTEQAQKITDMAVKLHGVDGVRKGAVMASPCREIRAHCMCEGASDVEKVVIARAVLEESA